MPALLAHQPLYLHCNGLQHFQLSKLNFLVALDSGVNFLGSFPPLLSEAAPGRYSYLGFPFGCQRLCLSVKECLNDLKI